MTAGNSIHIPDKEQAPSPQEDLRRKLHELYMVSSPETAPYPGLESAVSGRRGTVIFLSDWPGELSVAKDLFLSNGKYNPSAWSADLPPEMIGQHLFQLRPDWDEIRYEEESPSPPIPALIRALDLAREGIIPVVSAPVGINRYIIRQTLSRAQPWSFLRAERYIKPFSIQASQHNPKTFLSARFLTEVLEAHFGSQSEWMYWEDQKWMEDFYQLANNLGKITAGHPFIFYTFIQNLIDKPDQTIWQTLQETVEEFVEIYLAETSQYIGDQLDQQSIDRVLDMMIYSACTPGSNALTARSLWHQHDGKYYDDIFLYHRDLHRTAKGMGYEQWAGLHPQLKGPLQTQVALRTINQPSNQLNYQLSSLEQNLFDLPPVEVGEIQLKRHQILQIGYLAKKILVPIMNTKQSYD